MEYWEREYSKYPWYPGGKQWWRRQLWDERVRQRSLGRLQLCWRKHLRSQVSQRHRQTQTQTQKKTYTNTNTSLRGIHLLYVVISTSRCTRCFGWCTRCFSLYTWCLGALDVFGIRLMYQLHFVIGICLDFGKAVHSFLCLSTLACKKYAPASSDCSD